MAPRTRCSAPAAAEPVASHDLAPERRWRHLDTCQLQTLLVCSIPRLSCPEHGVQQLSVPWAEARSRFTLLFEALAIDLMLCCPVAGQPRSWGPPRTAWLASYGAPLVGLGAQGTL
jgi:hypothetical protein